MKEPPRPAQEESRLQALRALLILDTPPEERFDRLTGFAAQEFDMPIVLLSLVDAQRQWFKARHGLDVCETARGISFCGHAILQDAVMVVPDAALDERFADNPLVTGEPHIRFYAGAPLQMPDGHNIGTLCLIDRQPRSLDAIDLAILGSLRDLAVEELVRYAGEEPAA
jgi:GAF domain-containing protein